MVQKVIPHLWFDDQAVEAAEFYTALFPDSKVNLTTHYPDAGQEIHGQAAGSVMIVDFEVSGFRLLAINAGPVFQINPSISFILNFDPEVMPNASERIDEFWAELSRGGSALMELGEYPFSPKYGWVVDRFGVSWQLLHANPALQGDGMGPRPFVMPELMFANEVTNHAGEAIDFYTSIFPDSAVGHVARYEGPNGEVQAGSVMYGEFKIGGTWFAAMDSPVRHAFDFNPAVSLLVECESQDEIDRYWNSLSAVPEAEQCGWLADRFGVSWQINPAGMDRYLNDPDSERVKRNFAAVMTMKKFDMSKLEG